MTFTSTFSTQRILEFPRHVAAYFSSATARDDSQTGLQKVLQGKRHVH